MPLSFPISLPAPRVNNYTLRARNNLIYTTTTQGLERSRPRQTGRVVDYMVVLEPITAAQLATFRTFYYQTTAWGSLEFDWYDYSTSPKSAATFKFKPDNTPEETAITGGSAGEQPYFRVSFTLTKRSSS